MLVLFLLLKENYISPVPSTSGHVPCAAVMSQHFDSILIHDASRLTKTFPNNTAPEHRKWRAVTPRTQIQCHWPLASSVPMRPETGNSGGKTPVTVYGVCVCVGYAHEFPPSNFSLFHLCFGVYFASAHQRATRDLRCGNVSRRSRGNIPRKREGKTFCSHKAPPEWAGCPHRSARHRKTDGVKVNFCVTSRSRSMPALTHS